MPGAEPGVLSRGGSAPRSPRGPPTLRTMPRPRTVPQICGRVPHRTWGVGRNQRNRTGLPKGGQNVHRILIEVYADIDPANMSAGYAARLAGHLLGAEGVVDAIVVSTHDLEALND